MNSNLELLQSDFFQMTQDNYQSYHHTFDVIFDRASLVAISPSLREDYVQVCRKLLKPNGKILLIVIERIAGDITAGPPFSVTHEDVMRLYSHQEWVESVKLLEDQGEAQRNQVSADMVSRYYWIQCK
jgi:thiopurine S-methyltransferase